MKKLLILILCLNFLLIACTPSEYYIYSGNKKYDSKNYTGAIIEYNKAIELNLKDAYAYNKRGIAKEMMNDSKGAIADFNKAIEFNPKSVYFYNRGSIKYKMKDYRGAIADYSKTIELNPNDSEAYYYRGHTKGLLHDYRGAILDFSKTIELNPEYAMAYYERGLYRSTVMEQKNEGCLDLSKAGELGIKESYELIEKYCL